MVDTKLKQLKLINIEEKDFRRKKMKIRELIVKLQKSDPEMDVCISVPNEATGSYYYEAKNVLITPVIQKHNRSYKYENVWGYEDRNNITSILVLSPEYARIHMINDYTNKIKFECVNCKTDSTTTKEYYEEYHGRCYNCGGK
jgi:hypothetical protein